MGGRQSIAIFKRNHKSESRNTNKAYFRCTTQPQRGYPCTFEDVHTDQWHRYLAAAEATQVDGLRDGSCRLTSLSVAKLKSCSPTHPDWLGLLLFQLLTSQRKLHRWPRGAHHIETVQGNFAYVLKVEEGVPECGSVPPRLLLFKMVEPLN